MIQLPPKFKALPDEFYKMCSDIISMINASSIKPKIGIIELGCNSIVIDSFRKMFIDCSTSDRQFCFDEFGIHDLKENENTFSFKVFLATVTVIPNENRIIITFPSHEKLDPCILTTSLYILYTWVKTYGKESFKLIKIDVSNKIINEEIRKIFT